MKKQKSKDKVLFSLSETAEATGLDERSVRKAVEAGTIPGLQIGRLWKVPAWWIKQQRDGVPSGKAA